ncbi:MAG: glycosyltransferase family 2 protein [Acidobacteria bacterium]|nr:glycosyltransferase family 2 protein [Acidobacteriota bacterium]
MDGSIAVATITRGRPGLLQRAIVSLHNQDYSGPVTHLVVVDDCPDTRAFLDAKMLDKTLWHYSAREAGEKSGPGRVANLRNLAVRLASASWIAFLDDDNEFEPNHLSSLLDCALRSGSRAVHSHMKIFWPDGSPYLESRMPWWRDSEEGKELYNNLCTKGVFQPGSNIIRDRADPLGHPDPARTVDMGEWLLERKLLLEYPFPTVYDHIDWANATCEDDKLMEILIQNGVGIACSELPTLRYYLGGYSNIFSSGPFAARSAEDQEAE